METRFSGMAARDDGSPDELLDLTTTSTDTEDHGQPEEDYELITEGTEGVATQCTENMNSIEQVYSDDINSISSLSPRGAAASFLLATPAQMQARTNSKETNLVTTVSCRKRYCT